MISNKGFTAIFHNLEIRYTTKDMSEAHEEVVVDMISRSFADKGDLTTLAQVTYDDLFEQVTALWEILLSANLSFVIVDPERVGSDKIIGAVLNFDARSKEAEPLCACAAFERERKKKEKAGMNMENEDAGTITVTEFLQAVEEPLKEEHLPVPKGKTIYTSLLGTSAKLSAADNVKVGDLCQNDNMNSL